MRIFISESYIFIYFAKFTRVDFVKHIIKSDFIHDKGFIL